MPYRSRTSATRQVYLTEPVMGTYCARSANEVSQLDSTRQSFSISLRVRYKVLGSSPSPEHPCSMILARIRRIHYRDSRIPDQTAPGFDTED